MTRGTRPGSVLGRRRERKMSTEGKRSPDRRGSCWPGVRSAGPRPGTSWRPVPGPALLGTRCCGRCRPLCRSTGESTNAPDRAPARGTARQRRRPSCGGGRADRAPAFVPQAPNCAAPAEPAESRFRPEIPAMPSADALFFNSRPRLLDPLADALFVAFDGFARGLLRTPLHGVQQAADVIDVIANAKAALDVLSHAETGPKIGRESGCLRALEQLLLQPLALAGGEFKRPFAGRNRFQSCPAAQLEVMLPAAHAARIDIQTARDLSLSKPLFQQPNSMLALPLQLLWTALRPDKSPPHNNHSIGHYLCRSQ